jgi:multiple sugar transport system permease protein
MAERRRKPGVIKAGLSHLALIGLSIVFLLPFVWLLSTSLKSEAHISSAHPEFIPRAEYVRTDDGEWAEVVRNEVIKYADIQYDARGRALPRKPLISKVRLVDRWGEPLKERLFEVPAAGYAGHLDTGVLPEPLRRAMREHGIDLPPDAGAQAEAARDIWVVPAGEEEFLLREEDGRIAVYRDLSTQIVKSSAIQTRPWPTLRHYASGIRSFRFPLFLQNTLFICAVGVVGTVLSCSWVAFGFAILQWPGRDKVFYLMLATMMLPPQVTMIPLFVIFKSLGWVNTYAPLLVPAFMGSAFFIFLLRQFFLTIPKDLIDAARVDGCSTLRIYAQVVMPLSIPALATVALFTFMILWNDYMGPLIYVVDEAKYTLSLGLAMFKGRFATRYGEMMAVGVLLTLPIIVLFFFTQKTFIQGIKTSGMKG